MNTIQYNLESILPSGFNADADDATPFVNRLLRVRSNPVVSRR